MKFTSTENSSSASRVVIRTSNVFGIFTHHLERFLQIANALHYPKHSTFEMVFF